MVNKPKFWRGRKIYYSGKYPEVYWPEHPCSRSAGVVRIHRVIAYELSDGKLTSEDHVHHRDENPLNWEANNLEITSGSEHNRKHKLKAHNSTLVVVDCAVCSSEIKVYTGNKAFWKNSKHYCSSKCRSLGQERTTWPSDEELEQLIWKEPAVKIAIKLGVSDNAIRNRCKRRGIKWPPPYYWSGKRVKQP